MANTDGDKSFRATKEMLHNLARTNDDVDPELQSIMRHLPLGFDYPQLLFPLSSNESWFVVTLPDESSEMWHTTDGGATWTQDKAFPQTLPRCTDCSQGSSYIYRQLPQLSGRPCIGVEAVADNPREAPSKTSRLSTARYCVAKGGHSWMKPSEFPAPGSGDGDQQVGDEVFANEELGFSSVTNLGTYRSELYMTTDKGNSWYLAPASMRGSNCRVLQATADGAESLLLLSSVEDGHQRLMYSADRGTTWTEMAWMALPKTIQPRKVHIGGEKSHVLISLLVNGSDSVRNAIKDLSKNEVVIHDMSIESESTFKYESDDPYFKLMVYHATARVGSATSAVRIGEATALFQFFTDLGLKSDVALEGTYLEIDEIDCKIDVNADVSAPERFLCDLAIPY